MSVVVECVLGGEFAARREGGFSQKLKHDPEKWVPVFGLREAWAIVRCLG